MDWISEQIREVAGKAEAFSWRRPIQLVLSIGD